MYIYMYIYIETDIKELFVQTRIACKLVIGGGKARWKTKYKTDLKILHAVVPWFYMKYAEVLYLIFWYNKSHVISVIASSFLMLISCIDEWFCIKQDQFTKKAPSSALSQTRILMMVRIPRYTRICTLALLLQMYMSSISILYSSKCCKCLNTSAIYVFLTYIFFFFVNCNWRTHKKKLIV